MLGEGPADDINDSVGAKVKRKVNIKFITIRTKFCQSLFCNGDSSNLFAKAKKMFGANNKM